MNKPQRRKPRSDCNYIIYELVDMDGNSYIGLTRKTETTPLKSVKRRLVKHVSRAKCCDIQRTLYNHIRTIGYTAKWEIKILQIVRGRALAYKIERDVIIGNAPNLNEQYRK